MNAARACRDRQHHKVENLFEKRPGRHDLSTRFTAALVFSSSPSAWHKVPSSKSHLGLFPS